MSTQENNQIAYYEPDQQERESPDFKFISINFSSYAKMISDQAEHITRRVEAIQKRIERIGSEIDELEL